jgi:hypothetical protein
MPEKEPVVRRTISKGLQAKGWTAGTQTDGIVHVHLPRGVESLEAFIPLVDAAVREMGFVPRIRIGSNNRGETCLLLDTPETLKQAEEGRGQ